MWNVAPIRHNIKYGKNFLLFIYSIEFINKRIETEFLIKSVNKTKPFIQMQIIKANGTLSTFLDKKRTNNIVPKTVKENTKIYNH